MDTINDYESDTESENDNEFKIFPNEIIEPNVYSYKTQTIKQQLKDYREELLKTFYDNLNK